MTEQMQLLFDEIKNYIHSISKFTGSDYSPYQKSLKLYFRYLASAQLRGIEVIIKKYKLRYEIEISAQRHKHDGTKCEVTIYED